MTAFYLRLHFSEVIASFVMVLGLLLVWTFIKCKTNVFNNNWTKRLVGGALAGMIVFIGMFAGMALPEGHSWGNPAYAMGLALQHPWRVFTNDDNLLVIGLLYIVFQLIGAFLALGVFVGSMMIFNKITTDSEKQILLRNIFKMDTTHVVQAGGKDALASLIVIAAVIGASNFGSLPTASPISNSAAFATATVTAIATIFAITVFGKRGVLNLNPFAWAMAFIIKLTSALRFDKKAVTTKSVLTELLSPVAVIGISAIAGLTVGGILSLPSESAGI